MGPREGDRAIEVGPVGRVAIGGAEDAVQLDVHAHVLGAARLGLGEHARLQGLRGAAGEQLRG